MYYYLSSGIQQNKIMQTSHILFKQIPAKSGNIGLITLNRPEAMNALSGEMILTLLQQLKLWAVDPNISVVMITGAGERAFCAGGDLKMVYNFGPEHYTEGMHFYEAEYEANLLIHNYPKPYISLLNGVAMGGGLGISLHGTRVIATEKLQLAMPEVGIGFYPDVGAAYFFKRCPIGVGKYLGLTGNKIDLADAMFANLVDAYIPSDKLADFISDLTSFDLAQHALEAIDGVIAHHKQQAQQSKLQQQAKTIADCFNKNSVEDILKALQQNGSAWALEQLAILLSRSPTSLKATMHMLELGAEMNLQECLAQELILTRNFMQGHDIYEGIRAVLIDKTFDPKWQPATLAEVTPQQIDRLFK